MEIYYSVDRIEDRIAVLIDNDKNIHELEVEKIDFKLTEGDILLFDGENYSKSDSEKKKRRDRINRLQSKIFKGE